MFSKINKRQIKQIKLIFMTFTFIFTMMSVACASDGSDTVDVNTVDMVAEPETAVLADDLTTELPISVVEVMGDDETAVQTDTEITLALQTDGQLTVEEIAGLMFMREEEKLAHDVYLTLYELWGMSAFQNIAASEQMHTESVLGLLNNYGLADPAANNGRGEFTNQDLQALYDQLIATGSLSLADALNVAAVIEEIDILDLDERIASTTHDAIYQVYQNLRAGSENHLRAFVGTIERQTGVIYQPQYLDQTSYDAIMTGAQSQGNGNGNGNNGQGNSGTNSNGNGNGNRGNNGNGNRGNKGQGNGNGQNG